MIDRNIDINEKEEKLVVEKFSELKSERSKYIRKWKDIQDYVALTNEINAEFEEQHNKSKQKDVYINDPTGFICTNQAGDYLAGILWGEEGVTLEVSDYIKKKSGGQDFSAFYKKATEITLEQVNATDAGFSSILKGYCYEQVSFGTSGIGAYRSKEFDNEQSECCLNYKPYGVYNSCCDEGSNNKVNVIYTVYNWTINRIIEEFCIDNGEFQEQLFEALPDEIKEFYKSGKLNQKKKLVYAVMPNNFYRMYKRGKAGARYKGYWFIESTKQVFKVDYFRELPVAMCRYIRVNGQVYGESSGSLAISSIKILNHVKGDAVDNIEKTTDTPLGVYSGALTAGNVVNRSAGAITVFNTKAGANGQNPIFPISQTGDISAIVNFLLPELKKDITNIYKIDQLLDFNNQTQMTATESNFRMSIRGKSITGVLTQQKAEVMEPVLHRSISIIQDCGLYGNIIEDMPETTPEEIAEKERAYKEGDFIPPVIAQAMKDGKRWYKLRFNGELEKLCNAELYEAIGRFLQNFNAIMQIDPNIVHAINTYDFLVLLKKVSNLVNDGLVKTKTEYQNILKAMQQAQAQQQQAQALAGQVQMAKDIATADKEGATADVQRKANGL